MNNSGASLIEEMNALRQTAEMLLAGLRPILETQAIHTTLLRSILEAATAPVDADGLGDALAAIESALGTQAKLLMNIQESLEQKID